MCISGHFCPTSSYLLHIRRLDEMYFRPRPHRRLGTFLARIDLFKQHPTGVPIGPQGIIVSLALHASKVAPIGALRPLTVWHRDRDERVGVSVRDQFLEHQTRVLQRADVFEGSGHDGTPIVAHHPAPERFAETQIFSSSGNGGGRQELWGEFKRGSFE